jgi:hypothetical protein
MALTTWRRHHGPELVAHVLEKASDQYTIAAWHESSRAVERSPKMFSRLQSAKAAADDLVRRTFHHTCTLEGCGQWMLWAD